MSDYDAISAADLQAAGSLKWTAFPGTLAAWVAESDFGVAPAITHALHEAVDSGLHGYLPPTLVQAMAEATSARLDACYGWTVEPGAVHPVADVLHAFETTIEAFSTPGCPVIIPTPAYMPFLLVPRMHGRDLIELPAVRDPDGRAVLDLAGLTTVLDRVGSAVLVLCNPHNPLGTVATREGLVALSEVAGRYDVRVFADEIHAPITYGERSHVPYATVSPVAAGHAITAMSASKAWNVPGLKCAQLITSNPVDEEHWREIGFFSSVGTGNLGMVAAVAAYRDDGGWFADVLEYLDGSRRLLADLVSEHLPGVRFTSPEATFLAWLDCRELAIEEPLGAFFRSEAGVALTDGLACGQVGAGHVRLNFATPRPILRDVVQQMGEAVRRHS